MLPANAPTTIPAPLRPLAVLQAPLPAARPLQRALLRPLLLGCLPLLEIDWPERLAAAPEPCIFAFNHRNAFECVALVPLLMYLRGGRPVHFLADWMYQRLPLAGWFLRHAEVIPVYGKPARWRLWEGHRRHAGRRPVVDLCLAKLAAGASLGIFPEGTRNRDPERLRRGRRGLGELVLRSGAPVLPVGIRFPAAQRLGRPPLVGQVVLAVGTPLDFASERRRLAASPGASRAVHRELATAVVERVMDELAVLAGCRSAARRRPPPTAAIPPRGLEPTEEAP